MVNQDTDAWTNMLLGTLQITLLDTFSFVFYVFLLSLCLIMF